MLFLFLLVRCRVGCCIWRTTLCRCPDGWIRLVRLG
nr:MAG TPA: Thrombomodulin like fifth domain, EGF-like [Caudoviricetes sp.]